MESMNVLALIPARGGSKGIPHKNVRDFAGQPLISYTIEAAKNAPSVNRMVVSTDDEEIAVVAKKFGAEVPVMRPKEIAGDTSSVIDAVFHVLDYLKESEGYEPTHVLLLQPTSPLREARDIENAVALLKEHDADSVVSITRTENILITRDNEDSLTLLNPELAGNRGELPEYYKLDGSMIYLIKTEVLRKEKSFLAGKLVGYEIERWRAVDLDEPEDFVLGELIYAHKDELAKRIKDFS